MFCCAQLVGGGLLAFEEELKGCLCGEIVFQFFFYCFVAKEFSFESSACFNFIYLFDNLEMLRIWSLVGMQYSRCQFLIFIVWVVATQCLLFGLWNEFKVGGNGSQVSFSKVDSNFHRE